MIGTIYKFLFDNKEQQEKSNKRYEAIKAFEKTQKEQDTIELSSIKDKYVGYTYSSNNMKLVKVVNGYIMYNRIYKSEVYDMGVSSWYEDGSSVFIPC